MKKNLSKIEEKRQKFNLPFYTLSEEIMSAITHGIGALLAILATVLLLIRVPHTLKNILCVSIYCSTLFILYVISTLYHALKINRAKAVFRKFDHCSIFLLIAGTYTPVCLMYVNITISWIILSCVWIVALIGITLNAVNVNKFSKISLACYIIMGWSAIFMAKPVIESLSEYQLYQLLAGGIFYTVGAVLYVVGKKVKYMHSVWHLFVLAGSICHFMIFY